MMSDKTKISRIAFVAVYVDDYQVAFKFYHEVLGLEKSFDMGDQACFFKLGRDWGLYLEGGNKRVEFDTKTVRPAFILAVESAGAMYEKLKAAGVKLVQDAPVDMGQNDFWFQFFDPTGNILEILGGE